MLLIRVYVAPSSIEGTGLFAAESISKGTKIWDFMPGFDREIDKAQLSALPPPARDYVNRYSYPHFATPDVVIIDGDMGRFMNHSDTPNTNFLLDDNGTARCDIAAGEELTCDYREFNGGMNF